MDRVESGNQFFLKVFFLGRPIYCVQFVGRLFWGCPKMCPIFCAICGKVF